jgi:hypothetical protein
MSNTAIPGLPPLLRDSHVKLIDALEIALLAEWPEDPAPTYCEAGQVEAIARVIKPVLHDGLVNCRIAWVFKRKMGDRIGAKMSLAGGVTGWLADVDYTCVVSWEAWKLLSSRQKIALVDHELSHCWRNTEAEKWEIVKHDIEEFVAIAQRWGTWHHTLHTFKNALKGNQYEFALTSSATIEVKP